MRRSDVSSLVVLAWAVLLTVPGNAQQKEVLFQARLEDTSTNLSVPFEQDLIDRLVLLGYNVTVVDDRWTTRVDSANGKDLLYIAESGTSGNGDVYKDLPIPAVFSEAYGWDNWDWATGTAAWVDTQTQITITDSTHPLAAGLTGTVDVYNQIARIQGKAIAEITAPGAHVVATIAGDPTQATLVAVEEGGALLNGRFAPARQVGFFFGGGDSNTTPGIVTLDGWKLFDAAVRWADPLATPTAPLNLSARAGDGLVELTWDAPTSGIVAGYRVLQSLTSGGPYVEVDTTNLLTYDVMGLTNGTEYFFVVTAFNAAGDGARSNEASATPQAGISLRSRRWFQYR